MREPTEREILEVMDALLGFYAEELKRGDDPLTMRQVRLEAERACRAFLAVQSERLEPETAKAPAQPQASEAGTPRTDRHAFCAASADNRGVFCNEFEAVEAGFARQLEHELAALRADGGGAKVLEGRLFDAVMALTDAENQLSCIPPGHERDELQQIIDEATA